MTQAPRNVLSVVIWLAAALAAGLLWFHLDPNRAPMPALVDADLHRVGPVETARLSAVFVQPGQQVQRGDVLATLDSQVVDAELAVARGEQAEFLAQVVAERVALNESLSERRIDLQAKLAEARARMAGAQVEQAGRKAELKSLGTRLERLDGALQDGLVEIDRLTELRAHKERLARESRFGPDEVAAWAALDRTISALVEDDPGHADSLAPLRAQVETQGRRIELLLAMRERARLRAPVSGQVIQVLHRPGDTVPAGEPVVEVVSGAARFAVAYAPEEALRALTPGTRVTLAARDRAQGGAASGVVSSLGAAVVLMPERLWLAPNRPAYGRPVHVRLDDDHPLLPGEAASLIGVGGAQAAPSAAGPAAMNVPPALANRSRLEPSGAVWLPDLDRFLVVSDDTGPGGKSEHQPWVFLADAKGQFEAEPLVIQGAPPVSDLESITLGGDGALYLLASQSLSRKGKRKAPRQQLLRVKRAGRALELSGAVALYESLQAGLSASAQRTLGVGDELDVEGLAWLDGRLLLGLKTPIERGQARIWAISQVDALFDGRGFAPGGAQIEEYARVALPTGGGDGGIADLLVEGDTLYLLSTLPEGPPRGAAWRADLKLSAPPVRLQEWPLKSEALVRHPEGLYVFFDTGADAPRFTRLDEGRAAVPPSP